MLTCKLLRWKSEYKQHFVNDYLLFQTSHGPSHGDILTAVLGSSHEDLLWTATEIDQRCKSTAKKVC